MRYKIIQFLAHTCFRLYTWLEFHRFMAMKKDRRLLMTKQYEYHTEEFSTGFSDEKYYMDNKLKVLGDDGWGLKAVLHAGKHHNVFIFMRPK